jgi:hypothetical protein
LASLERFARPAPVYVIEPDGGAEALSAVAAARPTWDAVIAQAGSLVGPGGVARLAWCSQRGTALCHAALAYGSPDDAVPEAPLAAPPLSWEETARLALDEYEAKPAAWQGEFALVHWRAGDLATALAQGKGAAVLKGHVPELSGRSDQAEVVPNVLVLQPGQPDLSSALDGLVDGESIERFARRLAGVERVEPRVGYLEVASGPGGTAGLRRRLVDQVSVIGDPDLLERPEAFGNWLIGERIELVHAWNLDLDDSPAQDVARALAVPIVVTEADRRVRLLDSAEQTDGPDQPDAGWPSPSMPMPEAIDPGTSVARAESDHRAERSPGPRRVWAAGRWTDQSAREQVEAVAQILGPRVEWLLDGPGAEALSHIGAPLGGQGAQDTPDVQAASDTLDMPGTTGSPASPGTTDVKPTKPTNPTNPTQPTTHLPTAAAWLDPDIVGVFGPAAADDVTLGTEAWAAGIPLAVGSDSPLADQIRRFGGGQIADGTTPEATATCINALLKTARTPEAAPNPAALRSHLTAAEDYRTRVYNPASANRPTIGVVAARGLGTTEVRTGRMARAAEDLGIATIRWADGHDIATGADTTDYDAVIVQRAALTMADATRLIERLPARGTRLVVELDDDLVTPPARERLTGTYPLDRLDALATLAQAADGIVVSTAHLAGLMRAFAPEAEVSVVENRLDARLWFTAVDDARPALSRRPVYIGTSTHGADLALLEGLPELVSQNLGRQITFDVVGITSGRLPEGFRRVTNPRPPYGEFVPWLRRQASRWNVGLAPLAADPFNNSKSDLKLLEYAALGLATVASARGPYAGAQALAMTVDDDVRSWALAVTSLLRADRWRRAAAATAATVRQQRTISRNWVEYWVATIRGTVRTKVVKDRAGWTD